MNFLLRWELSSCFFEIKPDSTLNQEILIKEESPTNCINFLSFQEIDWILRRSLDYCVVYQVENPIICCTGKNFFFYFWIDPYHCGRIFHSSLLSMNIIFLVKIIELFCIAFLGSINWNLLRNFLQENFTLKSSSFFQGLKSSFTNNFLLLSFIKYQRPSKIAQSFQIFHGNKNSCNFFSLLERTMKIFFHVCSSKRRHV